MLRQETGFGLVTVADHLGAFSTDRGLRVSPDLHFKRIS